MIKTPQKILIALILGGTCQIASAQGNVSFGADDVDLDFKDQTTKGKSSPKELRDFQTESDNKDLDPSKLEQLPENGNKPPKDDSSTTNFDEKKETLFDKPDEYKPTLDPKTTTKKSTIKSDPPKSVFANKNQPPEPLVPVSGNDVKESPFPLTEKNMTPTSNTGIKTAPAPSIKSETANSLAPFPENAQFQHESAAENSAPPSTAPLVTETQADISPTAPQIASPNEFAGAPPIPGSTRDLAVSEAPEEYDVEPGDTLIDICDQLINEPGYWPKLWSLNPKIKNPHYIYPGMKLAFYSGDESTPPYLQVVAEDEVVPIDRGTLNFEQLAAGGSIDTILEQEKLQPTLVISSDELSSLDQSVSEIDEVGNLYSSDVLALTVPGFIFSDEVNNLGTITIGSDGQGYSGASDDVLINQTSEISPGKTYSVLRPLGRVKNVKNEDVGFQYTYVGNIKISTVLEKSGQAIGIIADGSRIGAQKGDVIVNYISTKRTITGSTSTFSSPRDASIVSFEEPDQPLGGEGSFAFFDRGSKNGISAGESFIIYQQFGKFSLTDETSIIPKDDFRQVGTVKIIDTTETGSVGYITYSTREMLIGDRTDKG